MRICRKCRKPIHATHRWHFVHKRFLLFTWTRYEHRSCEFPTMGQAPSSLGPVATLAFETANNAHEA
jgi:hypothetical protein